MRFLATTVLALATTASAAIQGFNYGAQKTTGGVKQESDFIAEFNAARKLVGAGSFTSARLYTMIVSPSPLVHSVTRSLRVGR
jgi:glucan endo-1,3-beta-D-glucosidase